MTIAIIAITVAVSIFCFQNDHWFLRLLLNPFQTWHRREWWRMVSHGFVHADWIHLFVNMFVLYSFGRAAERYFGDLAGLGYLKFPMLHYLIVYFGGMVVSSLPSLWRHRDNPDYNSVGASGAVSAILFVDIFFSPLQNLYLYFIPMPGIVFGVLYVIYSQVMSRRSKDNINHEAHLTGALFGFIYPILIKPDLIRVFLGQLGL
jgi:membrane associated rhomboid family serine protease